jgi:hypothetical protein
MLRNALAQEYGHLQVFCTLEKPLANYRAAFTRQRSLVRTQHRPLVKSDVLQVKRGKQEQVSETLPSNCVATVQERGGEPVNVTVLGERNHNAKQKDT